MHRNTFQKPHSFDTDVVDHRASPHAMPGDPLPRAAREMTDQQSPANRALLNDRNSRHWIIAVLCHEASMGYFYTLDSASQLLSWSMYLSPLTVEKHLKRLITKKRLTYLQHPEWYGLAQPDSGERYLICREMNLKPDPF